jgi:hypothetical protein
MLYGGLQHNPPSRFLADFDADFQVDSVGLGGSAWRQTYEEETYVDNFSPTKKVTDEPRYVPELNEGDSVKHDVFGQGTVMEVDGDNVVVYFKGKGAKKLNTSFAPIQKL